MSTLDNILSAFENFCRTGKTIELSEQDFGYIVHAFEEARAKATTKEVTLADHQLFMLMAVSGNPDKIEPFLFAVAENHKSKRENRI